VHIENPFGVDAYADIDVRGAAILKANSGSIAEKAGIKFNDIIQEFDGRAIATANDLQAAVASVPAGKQVPIKLHRSQKEISTTAQF
jgi:S1-C subfamily serine protease